jgi:glucosamine--fructose-6-phosphate aminotransferase (isomerizing)
MKHGPIALIDSDSKDRRETVVFLFIFNNDTYSVMMNALDQMHSRNAFVVVITDCEELIEENYKKSLEKNPQAEKKYHYVLNVPYLKHASHLLSIVPIQLFVEKMSLLKKIDPDHPRNLAKSVTV